MQFVRSTQAFEIAWYHYRLHSLFINSPTVTVIFLTWSGESGSSSHGLLLVKVISHGRPWTALVLAEAVSKMRVLLPLLPRASCSVSPLACS